MAQRPCPRPAVSLTAVLAAAVLALTGCGGDDPAPNEGAGSSGGASTTPEAPFGTPPPDAAPQPGGTATTGAPLPRVKPSQVASLTGTWVGKTAAKDYFVFKADGSGAWMSNGKALWQGQVIPEGERRYRFSWQGRDPQEPSYWSVTMNAAGTSLKFAGNNQEYVKKAQSGS